MGYLRNKATGAVTDLLMEDSAEYRTLVLMRFAAATTSAAMSPGILGTISGSGTYALPAGSPVWEDIAYEDAGFPDPPGGRVFAVFLNGATIAASETTNVVDLSDVAGSLTDVEYVPVAALPGVATNNRVITLNQVTVAGTSSPTRAVTALAAITFDASHSNAGGYVGSPLAISQAAFTAVPPETLEVVSSVNGTGQVDPGGVLYGVYTRA